MAETPKKDIKINNPKGSTRSIKREKKEDNTLPNFLINNWNNAKKIDEKKCEDPNIVNRAATDEEITLYKNSKEKETANAGNSAEEKTELTKEEKGILKKNDCWNWGRKK